jgi:general secretion pathway protein G
MRTRLEHRLRRLRKRNQRGMTLIEIMVVVAIISMLMGTVAIGAFSQLEKAKVKNAKMVIKSIEQALVAYQTDNTDSCPKQLNDLYTQKYLTKEPKDPWGEPLVFKCPGEHNKDGADIVSKGKDKQEGTADDVKSWEL